MARRTPCHNHIKNTRQSIRLTGITKGGMSEVYPDRLEFVTNRTNITKVTAVEAYRNLSSLSRSNSSNFNGVHLTICGTIK